MFLAFMIVTRNKAWADLLFHEVKVHASQLLGTACQLRQKAFVKLVFTRIYCDLEIGYPLLRNNYSFSDIRANWFAWAWYGAIVIVVHVERRRLLSIFLSFNFTGIVLRTVYGWNYCVKVTPEHNSQILKRIIDIETKELVRNHIFMQIKLDSSIVFEVVGGWHGVILWVLVQFVDPVASIPKNYCNHD